MRRTRPVDREDRASDRLVCVECGSLADHAAARWRAYLTLDEEVVTFCSVCARREFGDLTGKEGATGDLR